MKELDIIFKNNIRNVCMNMYGIYHVVTCRHSVLVLHTSLVYRSTGTLMKHH